MANGKPTVAITWKISPETKRFIEQGWQPRDTVNCLQIVEDELALENFPGLLRYLQGIWKPLTRPYRLWKQKHYPGKEKWELTGGAAQALTTRAKITTGGGSVAGKSITIARAGTRMEATYKFAKSVAGGYFEKNNRMRPIWELAFKNRVAVEARLKEYVENWVRGRTNFNGRQ